MTKTTREKVKEYAKKLQLLFPPHLAEWIAKEHYETQS